MKVKLLGMRYLLLSGLALVAVILLVNGNRITGAATGTTYGCGGTVAPDQQTSQTLEAYGDDRHNDRNEPTDEHRFADDINHPYYKDFPLFLYGVLPDDFPDVRDTVDIVYNNSAFLPSADNDASFAKPITDAMLDAAAEHGLRIAAQLPLLANRSLRYAKDPLLKGNGIHKEAGIDSKGRQLYTLYNDTNTVQIPLDQGEVTPGYINWILPRLEKYIHSVLAHPHSDRIEYWWGIEEIRSYRSAGSEYDLERQVRALIDRIDPAQRPLVSYMSATDGPPRTLALSLVAGSYVSTATIPINLTTQTVTLNNNNSAWIDWHDPGPYILDYDPKAVYPVEIQVWRENSRALPIHTHLFAGNYVPGILQLFEEEITEDEVSNPDYAQENRIWSYHQIERLNEAKEQAGKLVAPTSVDATSGKIRRNIADIIVFHMPSLTATNESTLPQARHDFWSGIHKAGGVAIYAYAYRTGERQKVWAAYQNGLRFIKRELRPFLNSRRRTIPVSVTSTDAVVTIASENYDQIKFGTDVPSNRHLLGYVPEYQALNATLSAKNKLAYLIVSHSIEQNIEFKIDCGNSILSVETVIGSGGPPSIYQGQWITDSFDGIDARVYRIKYN